MNRKRALVGLVLGLAGCGTANVAVNKSFDFKQVKRVAVIGFTDHAGNPGSGDTVTGAFEQSLLTAGYDVVERGQVTKVLQEQKFSGALDPKTTKSLGQSLGVDALLFGRVTDMTVTTDRIVKVDVVDDHSDPIYASRSRRIQNPDGTWTETSQEVVTGYKTTHTVHKEPRAYTVSGRLGVSARLVYVPSGGVLWSGSDSTVSDSTEESAHAIADSIMKAVKSTWPSTAAK
jgi:hypothetical protein